MSQGKSKSHKLRLEGSSPSTATKNTGIACPKLRFRFAKTKVNLNLILFIHMNLLQNLKDIYHTYTTLVYQLLCMFLATLCIAMYMLTQFNYGYMEAYKAQIDMLRQRTEGQSKQLIVLEERYKQQQQELNAFKSRTIAVETNLQYEIQVLKYPQKSITHLKR